ncbi:MAG: hypothetical protein JWQ62_566, partial [Lacunisphaera sp.]|nr:hypothetical protein [Lacunisphaera sp.]
MLRPAWRRKSMGAARLRPYTANCMMTLRKASLGRRLLILISTTAALAARAAEPGLLFYVSGDQGTTADFSAGNTAQPTYDALVTQVA